MISINYLLKHCTFCVWLLLGHSVFAQTTLTKDNFDSGWENWNVGIDNEISNPIIEIDRIQETADVANSAFSTPLNLDGKFQLYFDGLDDYVEDTSLLSGWSEVTLMGWIKIDPTGTGNQVVFGQNNFNIILFSGNHVLIRANNIVLVYFTPLPTDQWVHLSATYSDADNKLRLLVNGEEVANRSLSGTLHVDTTPFYIGKRHYGTDSWYFKGSIDEVRLFNKALKDDEIQKMVYQEIENNGNVRGTEIPRDISNLSWSNLIKYYRFDSYRGNITDDLTTAGIDVDTGATLHNMSQIDPQTAPMPFITQSSGNLATALSNEVHGVNGEDAILYDWSIVRVEHNDVAFDDTQKHLGLFINETDASTHPIEYHVTNDSELNVSWYLKLDGFIDLEGESQLVQGDDSLLDPASIGKIERDQQGIADLFTYNYWSSPVKPQNSATANYRVMDVMKDGTNPNSPSNITFSSIGYDGAPTNPIKIADYWIWKYANLPSNTYSAWQHVRRTGTVQPGEGFTMKGPGTGSISTTQNYVFDGLPNNGDITLTLAANNDYLVGNPYPSAIDANQFIRDNGPALDYNNRPIPDSVPLLSGTLYFWQHWGGSSHYAQDYQGGYATYNFSGSVAAAYKESNHPSLTPGGSPTKKQGQYIPVGQGFFVTGENAGTINFNNGQRVFHKENSNSVFMRAAFTDTDESEVADDIEEDLRMKFRIGFNSINTIRRQLLLTIDDYATPNVDWAFDGKLYEEQIDDMFWVINEESYIIQASNEADISSIYPLGIKTATDGLNTIMLDDLENVPTDMNVYLHDIALDIYHDLKESDYEIFLNAGEYLSRFEITFGTPEEILGIDDQITSHLDVLYSNDIDKIVVVNPNSIALKTLTLYNMLGQSVYTIDNLEENNYSEYRIKNVSTGAYIIKLQTATGSFVTKKIIIQ